MSSDSSARALVAEKSARRSEEGRGRAPPRGARRAGETVGRGHQLRSFLFQGKRTTSPVVAGDVGEETSYAGRGGHGVDEAAGLTQSMTMPMFTFLSPLPLLRTMSMSFIASSYLTVSSAEKKTTFELRFRRTS